MDLVYGILSSLLLVAVCVGLYYFVFYDKEEIDNRVSKKDTGNIDKELSGASQPKGEDFNIDSIPEEDQEYLTPIIIDLLKEFIPLKVRYPSNAMLIEHLGKSLGEATESFEGRRVASDDPQEGNEDWLKVAVWAIRLYKEGTVHNSDATRERFTMIANLSNRELKKYATMTMNQAGGKIQEIMEGDDQQPEEGEPNREQAPDVGDTMNPYTQDEIQDMKDAADRDMGKDDNDDDRIIKP